MSSNVSNPKCFKWKVLAKRTSRHVSMLEAGDARLLEAVVICLIRVDFRSTKIRYRCLDDRNWQDNSFTSTMRYHGRPKSSSLQPIFLSSHLSLSEPFGKATKMLAFPSLKKTSSALNSQVSSLSEYCSTNIRVAAASTPAVSRSLFSLSRSSLNISAC